MTIVIRTLYIFSILSLMTSIGEASRAHSFRGSPLADPQVSFSLSHPRDGATDMPLELSLSWKKAAGATEYLLQLSRNKDFEELIIDTKVSPSTTSSNESFEIKKKEFKLETGTKYYWRVFAIMPAGPEIPANENPISFTTTANFFDSLANHGFTLQKALAGPDKGELAEFSFLDNIGKKTVYSTNFALSWRPTSILNAGHTNVRLQTSVEGSLSSDDSESEDAWRLRFSSIFVTSFVRCRSAVRPCPRGQLTHPTIGSLYTTASLKYEGDRDFNVKKLSAEFLTTPNSHRLAIGDARPGNARKPPVQFQWRPFFRVDVGHTFRRGTSAERQDTILRLVPRVRTVLNLQFLRRALNMDDVNIFADNTFYYLPLENNKKRKNFFTSGIEFNFSPNLGIGLTYKTGRSAPKFEKINTLQAIVGIRFGK
jgi:hypothetical protein